MKLLIVSESPLDKIGNDYYAVDPWIRIPIQLANHCDRVTLWSPIRELPEGSTPPKGTWKVNLGKLVIEPHDHYFRFVQYYRLLPFRFFAWRKKCDRLISDHDLTIMRAPSPFAPIVVASAVRQKRPIIYMLLLNILTQSDLLVTSRGLKRLLYMAIVKGFIWQEKRCAKKSQLVYVYSKELIDRHQNCGQPIKLIQDPHLVLNDLKFRDDTCQSPVIRLLRICWLIPTKGVDYLLDGVALLIKKGLPVVLEIVGQERTPGYQQGLEDRARALGIKDKVTFSGWAPFDKVGEVYFRNDIQILSSLGEGTPRCIVEGFARGIPLVCTSVGGCADTLVNERDALMIPPANPQAIADGIERLITDGQLRRQLIKNGYESAKAVTFEVLGQSFLEDIKKVLSDYQSH